jgi:hypothetical protein
MFPRRNKKPPASQTEILPFSLPKESPLLLKIGGRSRTVPNGAQLRGGLCEATLENPEGWAPKSAPAHWLLSEIPKTGFRLERLLCNRNLPATLPPPG